MSLRINQPAPSFTAATTHGRSDFPEWIACVLMLPFSCVRVVPRARRN